MDFAALAPWLPFTGCVAALGMLSIWALDRRALFVGLQDISTSPVAGLQIGQAEVHGEATSPHPPYSPLACVPTVWWRIDVERVDGEDRSTVFTAESDDPFWVRDDTGEVRVDPAGAVFGAVEVGERIRLVDLDLLTPRLFAEHELRGGASMRSLATLQRLSGLQDRRREENLMVTSRHVSVATPVTVFGPVVTEESEGRVGVVFRAVADASGSGGRESQLFVTVGSTSHAESQARLRLYSALAICLAVAAATGATLVNGMTQWRDGSAVVAAFGAVVLVTLWAAGWLAAGIVRLRNRIVAVGQRAERAQANVDVALRRRHDLVPQLVNVVRAHSVYERETQLAAALARATSADVTLSALVEAAPTLATDDSFRKLARQLVEVENSAAYARRQHAEAVQVLADRTRTFPGLLIVPFVPKVRTTLASEPESPRESTLVR